MAENILNTSSPGIKACTWKHRQVGSGVSASSMSCWLFSW